MIVYPIIIIIITHIGYVSLVDCDPLEQVTGL